MSFCPRVNKVKTLRNSSNHPYRVHVGIQDHSVVSSYNNCCVICNPMIIHFIRVQWSDHLILQHWGSCRSVMISCQDGNCKTWNSNTQLPMSMLSCSDWEFKLLYISWTSNGFQGVLLIGRSGTGWGCVPSAVAAEVHCCYCPFVGNRSSDLGSDAQSNERAEGTVPGAPVTTAHHVESGNMAVARNLCAGWGVSQRCAGDASL